MHIPDGYLSPSTCAALFAAAAPFWYVATRKVNRLLNTRLVPLLAVFAAFSFVIMMFNLPLPGGTTGHATGVGIAAVVLGPWASILAVSIALMIQAFFFGDGGITAFGANCFNIAVVGSLVAYVVYRAVAGKSERTSKRRAFAAGVAGYAAINAAALVTAIEFGIQPIFFQDAAGTPLYAPYSLGIAVPAIMIPHLLVAGLAEGFITAGLVAYQQSASPSLLKLTFSSAPSQNEEVEKIEREGGWIWSKRLWIGMAVLMIITPLGLLVSGIAWGEWSAQDFSNPAVREEIAAVSGNLAPPEKVPQGLERISAIWTAPIPDYAPTFMQNESFGYILSAMAGTGLIILTFLLIGWMAEKSGNRGFP